MPSPGDYEAAWRLLTEDNPLPAVMGRVCYHPCETSATARQLDEAVGINSVERFLGDEAIKRGWTFARPAERKRQARAGRRLPGPRVSRRPTTSRAAGHQVEIHEAGPLAGGMMRFGIPKYRLPRDVLDAEVAAHPRHGRRAAAQRAKSTTSSRRCGPGGFDAAFLAVGAHIAKRAYIPAGEAAQILDAVSVLRSMEGEDKPLLGRRVVVYGGGNTALDVARTAKRLGASEAIIVYRRTREKMPAHDFEVEEALEEGVMIKWLSTIKQAGEGARSRSRRWRSTRRAFRSRPASSRRSRPTRSCSRSARTSTCRCSTACRGSRSRTASSRSTPNMMTGHPGIFAGGDMVPSERTVTVGVGHGKKAARHIDAWLRGGAYVAPPKHEIATFDKLNTWYYADAPKTVQPDARHRPAPQSTFDEVSGGLDESNALFEARRCLSCGNCFECDNCYGVCPDNAVIKLGRRASASSSTTTTARAAGCASRSARAARSRWCRRLFSATATGRAEIMSTRPLSYAWTALAALLVAFAGALLLALPASLPTGDAFAQDPAKKPAKDQAAKKDEPWPINDDVDDPAVWGKGVPAALRALREDHRHAADQVRRQRGVPRTPTQADPRSIVSRSKVEEDIGLKTMWQGYAFAADFREERGHAYMLDDQKFTQRQKVVQQPGACLNCHASTYVAQQESRRRRHRQGLREDQRDALQRSGEARAAPGLVHRLPRPPRPWRCASPVPPSSKACAPTRLLRASRITT